MDSKCRGDRSKKNSLSARMYLSQISSIAVLLMQSCNRPSLEDWNCPKVCHNTSNLFPPTFKKTVLSGSRSSVELGTDGREGSEKFVSTSLFLCSIPEAVRPISSTDIGLERLFIHTLPFWYIFVCSLIRDGVVTSVLSRFDKFEMFFGKMLVMLLMLFGSCSDEDPTFGVDGNTRGLLKRYKLVFKSK